MAALLSKSVVIGLPLALGIALWWRGRLRWRDAAWLAPLVVLAIVMTRVDMRTWGVADYMEPPPPWPGPLLQAAGAAWRYLFKLAIPYPLATFYPRWDIQPAHPLAWLPLVAGAGMLAWLWAARRRIGRGPLAATLYYGVLLGPTLGLIQYNFLHLSWMADRFQYLASAGPLALAAAGLTRLAERRRWPPQTARWAAGALIGVLGALCLSQASLYHDPLPAPTAGRMPVGGLRLFAHCVRHYPEQWAGHYMYGWTLMENGRDKDAVGSLNQALKHAPAPDYMIHYYLAKAWQHLGNTAEAEASFQDCLKLNPRFASGFNDYGAMLAEAGHPEKAIEQYDIALKERPGYPEALSNKGNALKRLKRLDEAERVLRQAIDADRNRAEFHNNLGMVMVEGQRFEEALGEFKTAVALNPRLPAARNNYAMGLAHQGRLEEAAAQFEAARQLTPEVPYLYFQLGEVYRAMNRTADAVRCYQQAVSLDPAYPEPAARLRDMQ